MVLPGISDKRVRVLFTTPILGHPAAGGPELRIENSIKALSQISDLYLYSRVSLGVLGGPGAYSFYSQYVKGFYFAPTMAPGYLVGRFARRTANFFYRKIFKKPLFSFGESEEDFRDLLNTADKIGADLIWLGYGNISYPLLKHIRENSSYKVVVDTDSVWSRFLLRGLPFTRSDKERERIELAGKAKQEEERWGTELADVTTAVSGVDREYYQSLVDDKDKVMLFSNVIDFEKYREVHMNKKIKKPCVYLAGSFGYGSPMEDAARWTIEKVMPSVWAEFPDVHFYILGKGSKEVLKDVGDRRVSVLGRVPSVLPYLCSVDIALVPLKFESGTRFKILEAGACGIPIVSTTLGAEGIPVVDKENILIADTPSDFADSIKWLLKNQDKARELSSNCREMVAKNYSISKAREEAKRILEYLIR
jgi:glycosyltransferase involved in cell wall biosynthesis